MDYFKHNTHPRYYKIGINEGLEVSLHEESIAIWTLTKETCDDIKSSWVFEKQVTAITADEFNEQYNKVKEVINKILITI